MNTLEVNLLSANNGTALDGSSDTIVALMLSVVLSPCLRFAVEHLVGASAFGSSTRVGSLGRVGASPSGMVRT